MSRTNKSNVNNINIPNIKFNLSGYYQSVRSLNNKLNNLICNIQCEKYDFLMLTETWLKSEVLNSELGFHNYNMFRCDRSNLTSNIVVVVVVLL